MDTLANTVQLVLAAFDFAFNFWFVLVFGTLGWRGNGLRTMRFMWIVVAVTRLLLVFNSEPLRAFFIPEPLNTLTFVVTGLVLFAAKLASQDQGKTGSDQGKGGVKPSSSNHRARRQSNRRS